MVYARKPRGKLYLIGGRCHGLRLRTVPGDSVRPTLSRVREALFNIIAYGIGDSAFLDLYAGTGSIGLEAWSRGAHEVCFVEQNRHALDTLRSNIEHVGRHPRLQVLPISVDKAITKLIKNRRKFDWVFIDAPYDQPFQGLEKVAEILNEDGIVINQVGRDALSQDNGTLRQLTLIEQRKYGRTYLLFYGRTGENHA